MAVTVAAYVAVLALGVVAVLALGVVAAQLANAVTAKRTTTTTARILPDFFIFISSLKLIGIIGTFLSYAPRLF